MGTAPCDSLDAFFEGHIITTILQKQRLRDGKKGHLFKVTQRWYLVWGTDLSNSCGPSGH